MTPNEEGRIYFLNHGSKYKNPYPKGSSEYNEFERGWSQALKTRPELMKKVRDI